MKPELMAAVHEFQNNCHLDWRLNTTFITLVPKVVGEACIQDYRPTNLLSGSYKILGKMLATRLKAVLEDLISDFNCGDFERKIQGVLIANKLLHTRLKTKLPGLIYKIDLEKAFDTISWYFLDRLLNIQGFVDKWR